MFNNLYQIIQTLLIILVENDKITIGDYGRSKTIKKL